MTHDFVTFSIDSQEPRPLEWMEPLRRTETSEWLKLLKTLNEPAARIESALAAVDQIQRGMRLPQKAAAIGTNLPGLLATLALRMRGAEIVAVGPFPEPLLSPNRVKGIPGWKHVWVNPALAAIPLVQEIGAAHLLAVANLDLVAFAELHSPETVLEWAKTGQRASEGKIVPMRGDEDAA